VRAVECGCVRVHPQCAALLCAGTAGDAGALWRDELVRTADGVENADPGRARGLETAPAPAVCGRCGRATQPGNHRAGAAGLGAAAARWLWPDGNDRTGRQLARLGGEARL